MQKPSDKVHTTRPSAVRWSA